MYKNTRILHIYIYIYVCICIYIYIYIYLHIDISYCARRLVKSRVANLPDPLLGCGRLAARPRQEQGGLSARPTPWLWAACSQTSPGAGWPQPDPLLWLWAACSQTSPGAGWPQSQTHSLAVGGLQPDPGQEQGGLRARPTPWLWAACSQTPVRSRVASEPDPLLDLGRPAAQPDPSQAQDGF